MKQRINKLSIVNKIALLAVLLVGLTNPWAAGYIGYAVELAATYYVLYSFYAFIVGMVLAVGVIVYFMYATREQINLPESNRSKKGNK